MKIAYVTNARFPTDWAHGTQIAHTCAALAKAGAEVELLCPARAAFTAESPFSYYRVPESFSFRRLFTIELSGFGWFGFILQAASFSLAAFFELSKSSATIYCRDEIVAAILLFLGKRNLVFESHNGAWRGWGAYAARRARAVVTVSRGLKEFYVTRGIASEKIHVIPNGIDLTDYAGLPSKEEARARLRLPLDKKIALYVGMFDGWKGMDTLLAAGALLPDDALMAVIGGEDKEHIADFARRNPKVHFLGYRPTRELASNLAAADVLVIPNTGKNPISVGFTSPLKLFAYMASGKPIVASDLPSIRELVSEKSAYLVIPDDAGALRDGILCALKDPDAPERARQARKDVEQYTWDARAESILRAILPA